VADRRFSLTNGKRVLYLTKDPERIRQQLAGTLTLRMAELRPDELLDDINTDVMTPAWVCFDFDPAEIAKNAYAGLSVGGQRLIPASAISDGGFEVIVAGAQKGVGSSREQAAQCEVFSGSRLAIASSFAPIHARNNINIGQLMGDHATLRRLEAGETIALEEFTRGHDAVTALIIESGGLLPFCARLARGEIRVPAPVGARAPMTLAEKILAAKLLPGQGSHVRPGDAVLVRVDAGYSHEFTTAQVDKFLTDEYGDYKVKNPTKFAVFEDHLIYATGVASMAKFAPKIERLRELQRAFAANTGVRSYVAEGGVSPGICHQVAREQFLDPGDFVQVTDSHTCMGGASGALAWGVGATEYAALLYWGFTPLAVPESIRFELTGRLPAGTTAKDVMLHILATYARREATLNRIMEFGGDGLFALSPDERATLANMATECSARGAVMEVDDTMLRWIAERRAGAASIDALQAKVVSPDPGAHYDGGVHRIDLAAIRPMVATPGDPDRGIASDPKNGAYIPEIGHVRIDIAYGGSCTAGKRDDLDMYARVMREAEAAGKRVAAGVKFYIQFGSQEVERYARERGYTDLFARTGVQVIQPGCGACIGCGPGVSERGDEITVSAINRNYKGRSGPGKLYLASPLTVAASAVLGEIVEYQDGMFADKK
jgi:3-isopropylmalate/(R)-2-methylmalate dehydratase large subunit